MARDLLARLASLVALVALAPLAPLAFLAPLAGCVAEDATADAPVPALSQALTAHVRTDAVVDAIEAANAGLDPALRAEKFAAMQASPFAFFRGSNHLYWQDLGVLPALQTYGGRTGTRTWLSGDMHVDNMGSFDDSQGTVVYALNDVDQAILGDYQLDVWRLAVSIALVARANGGFSGADQAEALDAFSEAYLDAMADFAGSDDERTHALTKSNAHGKLDEFLDEVTDDNSRKSMLDAWTVKRSGKRVLAVDTHPDLTAVSAAVDADLRAAMPAYRATLTSVGVASASFYQVKSVARRLHAGLGSLGVDRFYVLIEGASASQDDDRILDVKAQPRPAAYDHTNPADVSATEATSANDHARRVVLAHQALGARVDPLLGWMGLADGQRYSVRERSPWKDTFPTEDLTSLTRLTKLAEQWGEVLAAHHARADRDWNAAVQPHAVDDTIDALTDGDHAGFRALVRAVALPYADQVALDHQSFLDAW
ncbi:Hypothetical protein CAP_1445 [Chondromyces apiculatus DSM 436]|uniref:DUF2252 domain-containing protein n=2 Tax=Chondromyces apiculatus TaxID=51 RepID=A0A017TBT0_9BACT|nr:Hypothetical protein CAP_1445 [Chondromyces apiculatus DSM 436]